MIAEAELADKDYDKDGKIESPKDEYFGSKFRAACLDDSGKPLEEKWEKETSTPDSKKGMFKGKTKAELQSQLSKLKASGPHEKGSAAYTKEKELMFARRAKSGWGKVSK